MGLDLILVMVSDPVLALRDSAQKISEYLLRWILMKRALSVGSGPDLKLAPNLPDLGHVDRLYGGDSSASSAESRTPSLKQPFDSSCTHDHDIRCEAPSISCEDKSLDLN